MLAPASVALQYRPDLRLLVARWLDESDPARLPNEYAAILAGVREHAAGRLLLDLRRRSTPNPEGAAWVVAAWLPQLVAALAPQRPRLAYLVSPLRAQALRDNDSLRATAQTATSRQHGYDLALFDDEGAALRWLLEESAAGAP